MLAQAEHVLVFRSGHRQALEQVQLGHLQALGAGVLGGHQAEPAGIAPGGAVQDRQGRQGDAAHRHGGEGRAAAGLIRRPGRRDLGQQPRHVPVARRDAAGRGGLGPRQPARGVRDLGGGPARVLHVVGGLFQRLARRHHRPRLTDHGGVRHGRRLRGARDARGALRIGQQLIDQFMPGAVLGRRIHHRIDEARRLQRGDGPIGDHPLVQLLDVIGRGGLQRRGHLGPARQLGVDAAGPLHVVGEGRGRLGRGAGEGHVLLHRRIRRRPLVADLLQDGAACRGRVRPGQRGLGVSIGAGLLGTFRVGIRLGQAGWRRVGRRRGDRHHGRGDGGVGRLVGGGLGDFGGGARQGGRLSLDGRRRCIGGGRRHRIRVPDRFDRSRGVRRRDGIRSGHPEGVRGAAEGRFGARVGLGQLQRQGSPRHSGCGPDVDAARSPGDMRRRRAGGGLCARGSRQGLHRHMSTRDGVNPVLGVVVRGRGPRRGRGRHAGRADGGEQSARRRTHPQPELHGRLPLLMSAIRDEDELMTA